MSVPARWPRRLMLIGALASLVGAPAGNAPAQESHSHGLVFQTLSKSFVLNSFEDLVARIDCPRGFAASTGVARLGSEFNTDSRVSVWEKKLGKDYYEVDVTNWRGARSSLVLELICMKRETEPAPDEQGSEHSHKLAKPKIANASVTLDPDGGPTYSRIECRKGLAATGSASTVPEPYRTFIQEPAASSVFYGFAGEQAGGREGAAKAQISLSCQKLTTKRANGHSHELDLEVVSKPFRSAGTAAHGASSANKLESKTLRCRKGYLALSPGYSSGRDSSFRLAGVEPKGRKMKFYYSLPLPDTFFLSVVCIADTVS